MTGSARFPDDLTGTLSVLRRHEPDPVRATRSLTRGRSRLHARRLAREADAARRPARVSWHALAEPLIAIAAAAVFLTHVLIRATRLYGF